MAIIPCFEPSSRADGPSGDKRHHGFSTFGPKPFPAFAGFCCLADAWENRGIAPNILQLNSKKEPHGHNLLQTRK
jgi:hypothetical protein